MADIAITFETLYDILRREKSREELQELNPTFLLDVVSYLQGKQKSLESSGQDNLFAEENSTKIRQQIDNIKRIIRDIYDIREKKIIALARDVSRTGTNLINMKALLTEEEQMYKTLLGLFDNFRKNVLHKVLMTQTPSLGEKEPKTIKREVKNTNPGSRLVRFLEPVQQFVGPDLESVGPFNTDDTAELPDKVVDVLLSKNSVEIIEK